MAIFQREKKTTSEDRADAVPEVPGVPFVPPARTGNPKVDDPALNAARARHAYHAGGAPPAPAADDVETQCPHGTIFNACTGCLGHAGVPEPEIRARIKTVRTHVHSVTHPVTHGEG